MTIEKWMNFRVGVGIGGLITLALSAVVFWLREKNWKARVRQAEESKAKIIKALNDLPVFRVHQTMGFCGGPLIKTWIRCSGPEAIAWMSDWIYIVNMAAYGADREPAWRLMMVDYLGQEEVENIAREIRESDKSKEAIYVAVKRAFNGRDAFANSPFTGMDWKKVEQLTREPKCQKK